MREKAAVLAAKIFGGESMSERYYLSNEDLQRAVDENIITTEQADKLIKFLSLYKVEDLKKFNLINVIYYLGALIVISAMGWFMNLGWERFGGSGIFAISSVYAIIFILVGRILWFKKKLRTAGGVLFTIAVCMTPLIVYGFEKMTGLWIQRGVDYYRDYFTEINGSWLSLEISTIIAGLITLRYIRFPFLTAPVAFTFWFISMDLTPLLYENDVWEGRKLISIVVGLIVLLISYLIDKRTREDFSFWGYLFGMLAFWGGLSFLNSNSELSKFVYCLINIFLIFLSVWLDRRVFIVFGGLGVFGYLGHLSYDVFENSMAFPFILSFIGIAIIFLAVKYQKNRDRINNSIINLIPESLLKYRPANRKYGSNL